MTVTLLLNSYLEYKEMLDKMNVIIVKTMRAMSVCNVVYDFLFPNSR